MPYWDSPYPLRQKSVFRPNVGKCGKNTEQNNSEYGDFLRSDLNSNKTKTIFTTTVKYQLNYSPLVWMFCPRRSNNFINKVQKRVLRTTYNNHLTNFKSLLSNHNEITIHQKNLQVLMTEIYKIINHIAPPKSSLFEIRENTHNTRFSQVLSNESRRTVNYGLETICYRTPFHLPPEYKLANYLNYFQKKKKKLKSRKLSM